MIFLAIISRILAIITLAKVKWIMSIRAFWPEDYVSLFNSSLKGKFISKLHLLLAHFPDKRIFCSQSLLNKYLFYELLESSYNNQVIRNIAIEPDVIKRPEALIPTIVCLGSLIPRKNVIKVINMSNNLLKNIKHQTLIIGDGPLMDQLKSNSSSHIHFLGNCSNPWKVIPINSLLVSFSYSEGMPNLFRL